MQWMQVHIHFEGGGSAWISRRLYKLDFEICFLLVLSPGVWWLCASYEPYVRCRSSPVITCHSPGTPIASISCLRKHRAVLGAHSVGDGERGNVF